MAASVVLPEVEQSTTVLSGQFVVVKVQQGVYAVPISRVQEIVRVPEITAIPATTPDVLGVINLRGRILPVVDTGARLGLQTSGQARGGRVVVVEGEAGPVGLWVDDVSEVLFISAGDMVRQSDLAGEVSTHILSGVAKVGERMVLLLHLDAFLNP